MPAYHIFAFRLMLNVGRPSSGRSRLGLKQALEKKGGDCETDNNAIAHYRRSGSTVPGFHFTTLVLHRLVPPLFCSMANTDRGIRTPTSGRQP